MALSKDEVEEKLAERVGLSREKVTEVIQCLAGLAYEGARDGIAIRGFGEFRLVAAKGREGVNPFTGETVVFKAPPEIQFTPDSESSERFRGRRGQPVEQPWGRDEPRPIPEVHLDARLDDWKAATGGAGGGTDSKLGGAAKWIQADETPVCCGEPSQFCGQLDLAPLNGPEMIYVFFCNRCYTSSSVYQCS